MRFLGLSLLLLLQSSVVAGAVVYERQNTGNMVSLRTITTNLTACAIACEQSFNCSGFAISSTEGCQNLDNIENQSNTSIIFKRSNSDSAQCPVGSAMHSKTTLVQSKSRTGHSDTSGTGISSLSIPASTTSTVSVHVESSTKESSESIRDLLELCRKRLSAMNSSWMLDLPAVIYWRIEPNLTTSKKDLSFANPNTTASTTPPTTSAKILPIATVCATPRNTVTTSTVSHSTTTLNALRLFILAPLVSLPNSTVPCYYETRSQGRFSTNGLCAIEGSDPCASEGLVSVFGNCVGLRALSVADPLQCASTLQYKDTLCVPWEAMFADKINPTALGTADNNEMMTGRATNNVLSFRSFDQAGLMIGACNAHANTTRLQSKFCSVHPNYTDPNCSHGDGNIGWTEVWTSEPPYECLPNDFFQDMGSGGCGNHSIFISGSGGSRCFGFDIGSTASPFEPSLATVSNWFVWDGNSDYTTGPLLTYEDYMVLPRVLVTPL